MHTVKGYMACPSYSGDIVLIRKQKKAGLWEIRVNAMKERFVKMKISFNLRRNGCHKTQWFRWQISYCGQAVIQNSSSLARKYLKFDNFYSKAHLGCLNGFLLLK